MYEKFARRREKKYGPQIFPTCGAVYNVILSSFGVRSHDTAGEAGQMLMGDPQTLKFASIPGAPAYAPVRTRRCPAVKSTRPLARAAVCSSILQTRSSTSITDESGKEIAADEALKKRTPPKAEKK